MLEQNKNSSPRRTGPRDRYPRCDGVNSQKTLVRAQVRPA